MTWPSVAQAPSSPAESSTFIHLFGGPAITTSRLRRLVPDGSKRLVALLALDRRCLDRRYVAGTLWPDADDNHAAGCLRTALWRLRQADLDVLTIKKNSIQLVVDARVDSADALAWANRVLGHEAGPNDLMWPELRVDALDLLPGWYDDWVIPHREHLRQRILHALDEMSVLLSQSGRHADAVEAAHVSVSYEPLRESAQRALVRAHLAEGNAGEAWRAYERFAQLLDEELGLEPTDDLAELVGATVRRMGQAAAASRVISRHLSINRAMQAPLR